MHIFTMGCLILAAASIGMVFGIFMVYCILYEEAKKAGMIATLEKWVPEDSHLYGAARAFVQKTH